jgi:hypothetical protein
MYIFCLVLNPVKMVRVYFWVRLVENRKVHATSEKRKLVKNVR